MDSSTQDDSLARPDPDVIQRAWTTLFSNPMLSTTALRQTAVTGLPSCSDLGLSDVENWVPLRSLHWKLALSILPSPTPEIFQTSLQTTRQAYDQLRVSYLRSPDGRYPTDVSVPPSSTTATYASLPVPNGGGGQEVFDPLSLEEESPWKKYYTDLEVRKEIRKDVERTFPDIGYFKTDRARVMLTTILFLHCTLHPDVGYRQGMHELAAAMLLAVELDSLPPVDAPTSSSSAILGNTLSRSFVEHDAYTLFSTLMRNGAQAFYAHHPEPETQPMSQTRSGTVPAKEPKQPIIKVLDGMWDMLGRVDPALKAKLDTEGIEPQLFGIRWIRLLFTREFPLLVAMSIWDALFALDTSLGLTTHICIALLLRIRNILLAGDYSDCLTSLLRYPGDSADYPLNPRLLVRQALILRDSPTPTTGVHLIIQNSDLLGISAQAPKSDEEEGVDRRLISPRRAANQQANNVQQRGISLPVGFNLTLGAAVAAAHNSGLGELAKGLAIKGREIGEKALRDQVSQMKRNLPEFPSSPNGSGVASPRPPSSFNNVTPSASSLEDEVASLKAKMWSLGSAVDRCVTSLDQIQLNLPPGAAGLDEKLARALVGLQIVRDSLGDPERPFDGGVLHEVLDGHRGSINGDSSGGQVEGETEPSSPTFTPIVSPSPPNRSPFIPPQPPSPSASPPPELATGNVRTYSATGGVPLPTLSHPHSNGLPVESPLPTPISPIPPPQRPTTQNLLSTFPATRLSPTQTASRPSSPATSAPRPTKTPPWTRAPTTSASSSELPTSTRPTPTQAGGDPLAGLQSATRGDHWRSVSSSKKDVGGGGDPLGAL